MKHSPSLWPEVRVSFEVLSVVYIVAYTMATAPLIEGEGHYRKKLQNCLDGGGFVVGSVMHFCNPVMKVEFISALRGK